MKRFTAAPSYKRIAQASAITIITLLLSSWDGKMPAYSQTGTVQATILSDNQEPPVRPPHPPAESNQISPNGRTYSSQPYSLKERQEIQRALRSRSFYSGDIDGDIGPRTRQAIREYQSSIGVEPTGSLTAQELMQLLDFPQPPPPDRHPGCSLFR